MHRLLVLLFIFLLSACDQETMNVKNDCTQRIQVSTNYYHSYRLDPVTKTCVWLVGLNLSAIALKELNNG